MSFFHTTFGDSGAIGHNFRLRMPFVDDRSWLAVMFSRYRVHVYLLGKLVFHLDKKLN